MKFRYPNNLSAKNTSFFCLAMMFSSVGYAAPEKTADWYRIESLENDHPESSDKIRRVFEKNMESFGECGLRTSVKGGVVRFRFKIDPRGRIFPDSANAQADSYWISNKQLECLEKKIVALKMPELKQTIRIKVYIEVFGRT